MQGNLPRFAEMPSTIFQIQKKPSMMQAIPEEAGEVREAAYFNMWIQRPSSVFPLDSWWRRLQYFLMPLAWCWISSSSHQMHGRQAPAKRSIWTRCKSNMKPSNAYMLDFTKPSSTPMASQHVMLMMWTLLNGATSANNMCQLMMLHLAYLKLLQVENLALRESEHNWCVFYIAHLCLHTSAFVLVVHAFCIANVWINWQI